MNPLLIRRRGMMMAGKVLPYDAEIEYLEANNTYADLQLADTTYLDTLIYADGWTSLEIKYSMSDTKVQRRICGCYWDLVYLIYTNGQTKIATSFSDSSNDAKSTFVQFVSNTQYIVIVNAENLRTYINGVLTTTRTTRPTNTCENTFKLFAAVDGQKQANGRIYYCKLWHTDNGVQTMLRDFIPVRVGTVGYMYDRVSEQLFGNAGTGDFVLGPDVQ